MEMAAQLYAQAITLWKTNLASGWIGRNSFRFSRQAFCHLRESISISC